MSHREPRIIFRVLLWSSSVPAVLDLCEWKTNLSNPPGVWVEGREEERRRTSTPRTSGVWRKSEPFRPVHLSVVLDLARRSKPEQQQQDSQRPIFSPVTLTVTFLQSLSAIKDVIGSRILAHSSERVLTFDPDIVPLGL